MVTRNNSCPNQVYWTSLLSALRWCQSSGCRFVSQLWRKVLLAHTECLLQSGPALCLHLTLISVIYILHPEIYFPGQKVVTSSPSSHLNAKLTETNKDHYPFLFSHLVPLPVYCHWHQRSSGSRNWPPHVFPHCPDISLARVACAGLRVWAAEPESGLSLSHSECRAEPNMGGTPGHRLVTRDIVWHHHKCHDTHPTNQRFHRDSQINWTTPYNLKIW